MQYLTPEVLDEFTPDREFRQEEAGNYSVLDHGYLKLIESWGSDERIIETARMSTDKGFLAWEAGPCPICGGVGHVADPKNNIGAMMQCHACEGKGRIPGDAKLLAHLYDNKHSGPFEFAGLTIEVQAPIMVFRQWHRHRTQSYDEMSGRYIQMPNEHYVPSVARIVASSRKSANKQASGGGVIQIPGIVGKSEEEMAAQIQELIRSEQGRIYSLYEELLAFGVSKEIARVDTPVSRYSRMRATGNLRNWLAFLTLRMDPHAQFETRQYAWCVADIIAATYPRTYELFFKNMLPLLEPDLAPRRLLNDTFKAFEGDRLYAGITSSVWWLETVEPLKKRLRRALGKAA